MQLPETLAPCTMRGKALILGKLPPSGLLGWLISGSEQRKGVVSLRVAEILDSEGRKVEEKNGSLTQLEQEYLSS